MFVIAAAGISQILVWFLCAVVFCYMVHITNKYLFFSYLSYFTVYPLFYLQHIFSRYEWYQSDSYIVLSILVKQVKPENLRLDIHDNRVSTAYLKYKIHK